MYPRFFSYLSLYEDNLTRYLYIEANKFNLLNNDLGFSK